MLYDGNVFPPIRNRSFLDQKRSVNSVLKATPRTHSRTNDQSDSLGVDSVHMMATVNMKWGPISFTFEGAAHREHRQRRRDTFPVNLTSSTIVDLMFMDHVAVAITTL